MFQGFAMNAWLSLKINQWWVIILSHTHTHISRHTKKISLVPSKQHECKNCQFSGSGRGEATGSSFLGLKVDITPVAELPAQKWIMGAWVGVADIGDHLLSLLLATLSPFLSLPPFSYPSSLLTSPLTPPLISPAVFSPWNWTFFLPKEISNLSTHRHLWRFYHCAKPCNCQQVKKPKLCPIGTHSTTAVGLHQAQSCPSRRHLPMSRGIFDFYGLGRYSWN